LSLQSILMTAAIIGKLRAWTYVGLVAIFSMASGLIYGAWTDGAPGWLLLVYLVGFLGLLAAGTLLLSRHPRVEAQQGDTK